MDGAFALADDDDDDDNNPDNRYEIKPNDVINIRCTVGWMDGNVCVL